MVYLVPTLVTVPVILLAVDRRPGSAPPRSVSFRRLDIPHRFGHPGGSWSSDPIVAVRYGSGRVIHARAITLPVDPRMTLVGGVLPVDPRHVARFRGSAAIIVGWIRHDGRDGLTATEVPTRVSDPREDPIGPCFWTALTPRACEVVRSEALRIHAALRAHAFWAPLNCDRASRAWFAAFARERVPVELWSGVYLTTHGEADHTWLRVDGELFDPTAGQFGSPIIPGRYRGARVRASRI